MEGREEMGQEAHNVFGSQAEQEHPLQLPAQSTDRLWVASCPACLGEKRWKEAKHQLTLRLNQTKAGADPQPFVMFPDISPGSLQGELSYTERN